MADTAPTQAGQSASQLGPSQSQQQPTTQTAAAAVKQVSSAIPVGLNEASLDSPTFRAVSVHFADQIDSIERWLDGYAKSTSKLVQDALSLEETINTYLSKTAAGPSLPDGVIDGDYTSLALKRVSDLSRERWTQFLSLMRRYEAVSADPIRNFIAGELRAFKDARRQLDLTQKTFDATLARYVGQSKTKEPSSLREDAFAVYETRKAYLRASMDYCQLAPQLRYGLDKLLVRICTELWRELRRSNGGGGVVGGDDTTVSSVKWAEQMDRVKGWAKDLEASEAVLKRELQAARRDIGEATLAGLKPSRELDDYSSSTVPFLGSRGPMAPRAGTGDQSSVISEKQGWLFLRTISGKPAKVNWIRRWYYCRDGIFGWLVAGSSGVLQGDEIGLLLCNAKPAFQEERRFCFEVKTKSQTLMLQAETQAELIEWLEVFEVAKKHAFEASLGRDNTALPGGVDPAFAITPPSVPEFSAKLLDTQIGLGIDDSGQGLDRSATIAVSGADGSLIPRASFDVSGPRRSVTGLGREEGESNREHAARLMQRLDMARKGFASGTEGSPAVGPHPSGGIAGLISASQNLLPVYAGYNVASQQQVGPLGSLTGPPRVAPSGLQPFVLPHPGSLAPATFAKPPVATGLSRNVVIASGERGMGGVTEKSGRAGVAIPAALLANYWGSSSWGTMYSSGPDTPLPKTPLDEEYPFQSLPPGSSNDDSNSDAIASIGSGQGVKSPVGSHHKTHSVDPQLNIARAQGKAPGETFPSTYPSELKAHHAQFRLLFPTVPLDEKLVLVFNAAWSSYSEDGSRNQSLIGGGRIYVTPDNMYLYGHQMGLVIAHKVRLDIITEVTAAPGKECDFIFLHLGQDMNDTGFTRITIKTFLEELPLLQSRLNLLIDNLQAEEPLGLLGLIAALINLEREEYDRPSPSAESWEEIPSSTPVDDGTHFGRQVSSRSGGVVSRSSRGHHHRGPPKFQLPPHPVIYEPEDMQQRVAERHFEISAKACFHVLFGDKSFIFPKLYFERRAKEIAQGPWELADHGKMKRKFMFKIEYKDMLGRKRPADVVDVQTIDVFSDHVTYVVTHVKTPWHLPHSQAFKLVTKVVITYLAKSKCKLAIYTKVDWSKTPAFAKNLVERQASNDVEADAEELAEVATDQVRKLGPHSRTKRAIQVCGNIGQQTQVVVFTPGEADGAKKPQIKPRTLTAMIFETLRSFMESVASSLMMWAFAAVRKLYNVLTAHRVILALLAVSVLGNVVFTSKESSTWWAERNAARFMGRLGVGPNILMSKAIYMADLDRAAESSLVRFASKPSESVCYDTFRGIMNATDMDLPYQDAGSGLVSSRSKAAAQRIRRTRQRLGSYRHDLVVAMRVVNSVEREMIQSEWENWLMDENHRCEQVKLMLFSPGDGKDRKGPAINAGDVGEGTRKGTGRPMDERRKASLKEWYDEYCGSCRADQDAVLRERRSPGAPV